MRTRTIVFETVALLFILALGTRRAVAVEPAPRPPAEQALRLWNEGRPREAMAELQSVIEELERQGDVEQGPAQLKGAYFLLGLMLLSVDEDLSAFVSFVRAGEDPAQASEWKEYAPALLRLYERIFSESDAETAPPGSRPLPVTKREESGAKADLAVGRRVRAELSGEGERIVGSLSAITDRGLILVIDEQAEIELPRARIQRLEMSYGRKGHSLAGLLIGAGAGALLGALEKPDKNCVGEGCLTRGENIGYGALGAGVLGGLVGALIRTDRWLEIPSDRFRLRVDCGREKAGIQVALSF